MFFSTTVVRNKMQSIDYQDLVWNLGDFIELRFGVYLDTVMGFKNNIEKSVVRQQQASQLTKLSIEELDKVFFVYGDGPPSADLEECKKREIHRRTPGRLHDKLFDSQQL